MNDDLTSIQRLRTEIFEGKLNRRDVLKHSLALGLSAPVIASLLAACGGDDDDDSGGDEATEEPAGQGEETEAATETDATEEATEAETEAATEEGTEAATEEGTEASTEESTEEAAAGPRGGGGKATLLYWQAPTILNPHLATGTKDFHASVVAGEGLFEWDENTEPILYLASEWPSVDAGTLDPEGMFVIWKLREGVKWHDGEDFNAEDVKFTWEYIVNPETTSTSLATFQKIESVDIIDDYTVQLNFAEPNPAWFDAFQGSAGIVLPEHVLRDSVGAAARDAPFNLMPIYTGPYKVVQFNPGDVVLYEIFEDYWDDGLPFFDEIEMKGGGDAVSAARAVVETGEADWAWNLQIEQEVLDQLSQGSEGQIVTFPGTSAERIMINFADPNTEVDGAFSEPTTQHPIWQHKEAREALNLAVQRDVIANQLYGTGNEATGDTLNVPPRFKFNWPWEYNLDAAKEKMAAINFPADFDNTRILYSTSTNTLRQKTQEVVKADLEQLGFQVELKSVDSGVFFSSDAGNPDNYPHFYADIEMYTNGPGSPYPIDWASRFRSDDIAQKANNWSGTNITRYANPEFDKLHDQAKTEIDEEKQVEIWEQMFTIVNEDIVEVPQVWRGGVAAVHNRIDGWRSSTFGSTPVSFMKYWKLKES